MEDESAYMNHLASFGRNGDTMLAHINEDEAQLLEAMGGSGTTNPDTGLPEFFFDSLFSGVGDFFGGIGDAVGGLFGGGGGDTSILSAVTDAGGGGLGGAFDVAGGVGGGAWDTTFGTLGSTVDNPAFAPGAAAGGNALSNLFAGNLGTAAGQATDWLGRNAGWLLPAAGLGYAALQGQGQVPYQNQIQQNAKMLTGSAGQLTAPLLSNAPLPSGAQAQIDATAQAQAAAIRNQFANMGLSGSSMEAQALAQVENQKNQNYYNEAMKLAQQGFTNIGAANTAYGNLANAVLQRDAAFTNALGAFAGAMGRTGGLTAQPTART